MGRKKSGVRAPHDQPVSPSVLLPADVIRTYGADEWEAFVLESLEGANPKYVHIDRIGSAGDKGRDIVAHTGKAGSASPIDIYQCKHYDHPLLPSDVWLELGKLCVYTWRKDYPIPRRYRFVAPRGIGTKLYDLLRGPEMLRAMLIEKWAASCETEISREKKYPLGGPLLEHVRAFDFGIVWYEPINELLARHHLTRYWHLRFKRDLPERPAAETPPDDPESRELPYVNELLAAYGDFAKRTISAIADLGAHSELRDHFVRSRKDFFMADSLNRFYRDQFVEGAFENVKRQICDGVIDTANGVHADGYARAVATTTQAVSVALADTEYVTYIEPSDRKGICHHLVNDKKLRWVRR